MPQATQYPVLSWAHSFSHVASQHSSESILGALSLGSLYRLMIVGPADGGQCGGLSVHSVSEVSTHRQAWKPAQGHWSGQCHTPKYTDCGLEERTQDLCGIATWPYRSLPHGQDIREHSQSEALWSPGPRAEAVLPWFKENNSTLISNLLNTYSLESLLGITDKSEFSLSLFFFPSPYEMNSIVQW